jgi:hypothetical protein
MSRGHHRRRTGPPHRAAHGNGGNFFGRSGALLRASSRRRHNDDPGVSRRYRRATPGHPRFPSETAAATYERKRHRNLSDAVTWLIERWARLVSHKQHMIRGRDGADEQTNVPILPGGGGMKKSTPLPSAERRRTFVVLNVKFS